jgi:hypothetical protein
MIVSYIARQKSKSSKEVLSANRKDMSQAEQAYEMGFKYYRGGGDVFIDHKEAFAHFSRAAELGLPEAQAHLSGLLGQKYGLEFRAPDQKLAAEWAQKALASGLEAKAEEQKHRAEYELAAMYCMEAASPAASRRQPSFTNAPPVTETATRNGFLGSSIWEDTGSRRITRPLKDISWRQPPTV